MNLKIALQVAIRTPKVPWIFLQPTFHNNPFFDVINAPIEGKYTKSQQLNINVMVDLPKDDKPISYTIRNGDILCYLWFAEDVSLKYTEHNLDLSTLKQMKTFYVKNRF